MWRVMSNAVQFISVAERTCFVTYDRANTALPRMDTTRRVFRYLAHMINLSSLGRRLLIKRILSVTKVFIPLTTIFLFISLMEWTVLLLKIHNLIKAHTCWPYHAKLKKYRRSNIICIYVSSGRQ